MFFIDTLDKTPWVDFLCNKFKGKQYEGVENFFSSQLVFSAISSYWLMYCKMYLKFTAILILIVNRSLSIVYCHIAPRMLIELSKTNLIKCLWNVKISENDNYNDAYVRLLYTIGKCQNNID